MQKVIERILNLLAFLLTAERPVTADEIRTTVAEYDQDSDDAWRRMFERDKDLLRSLGIPLKTKFTDIWEVEVGYEVPLEEYALEDPELTDEERTALWLAAKAVRIGGRAPGTDALFKLGGAPLVTAGEPLAANLGGSVEALPDLFESVAQQRRVSFHYRDKDRILEPYELVHRRGHWYLVGVEWTEDIVKVFRVDRIEDLILGDESGVFRRPRGFHAADAIPEVPWEAGPEDEKALVRFDADIEWWARRQLAGSTKIEDLPDGAIDVTFRVANPEAFIGWVLSFDDSAEILEPHFLRQRLVSRVMGKE